MGYASKLILFPVVAMFCIVLVNTGTVSSGSYTGIVQSREVTDNEILYFDSWVDNNGYDLYGEDVTAWNGTAEREFTRLFGEELDKVYGDDYSWGHQLLGDAMYEEMVEWYEENASRVDNVAVEYIISRDPQYVEEWEELNNSNIRIDNSIYFIAIISIVAMLIFVSGFHILGSGFPDISIITLGKMVLFLSMWTMLSAWGYSSITDIPVFGSIFYIVLTLIYAIGCIMSIIGESE